MVKIKITKVLYPDEEQYVGGTYEALEMNYSGKVEYATRVREDLLIPVKAENCVVIEDYKTPEKPIDEKILLVQDGSVDIDALEEWSEGRGIHVVVYRNGANKPEFLNL